MTSSPLSFALKNRRKNQTKLKMSTLARGHFYKMMLKPDMNKST